MLSILIKQTSFCSSENAIVGSALRGFHSPIPRLREYLRRRCAKKVRVGWMIGERCEVQTSGLALMDSKQFWLQVKRSVYKIKQDMTLGKGLC